MAKQAGDIDEVDRGILRILARNSRTPYRRIAEELGLSESTIYLRIRKLSELGILRRFTVDVDLRRLGLSVMAYVMLRISPRNYEETLKSIVNIPGVEEAYEITGEYQVLLRVRVLSNRDLARVIDGVGSIGGVLEAKVMYVTRELKSAYELVERGI